LLNAFLDQVARNRQFGVILTLILMALGAFQLSRIQSDESAARFSLRLLTVTGGICSFVTFAVILMFFKALLGGVIRPGHVGDGRLPFAETYFATNIRPVSLPEALASRGRAGYAPLIEGYRGELRFVASTGRFAKLEHRLEPETLEFNKVNFDNRGVGALSKPAFAIIVPGPTTFRRPAIHLNEIPSIDRLKEFQLVADFERTFGEFRGLPDGWGGHDGIHDSRGWTGFTLQPDGSARVVSVFVHTLYREAKVEEFEGDAGDRDFAADLFDEWFAVDGVHVLHERAVAQGFWAILSSPDFPRVPPTLTVAGPIFSG